MARRNAERSEVFRGHEERAYTISGENFVKSSDSMGLGRFTRTDPV
jgi:hypothetical protein